MLRTWRTTTHIAAVRDGQTQGGPRKRRLNVSIQDKLQPRVQATLMHPENNALAIKRNLLIV